MKKLALPLVFTVFSMLAPVVRADDGSVADSFEQVIGEILAIVLGDEAGVKGPGGGVSGKAGDPSEIGELFPPFG